MSEDDFKRQVVSKLSSQLIYHIDKLVISKALRFTQKQAIINMRESGLMNAIILGEFKDVSLDMIIDLFCIFEVGLSFDVMDKETYNTYTNVLTVH